MNMNLESLIEFISKIVSTADPAGLWNLVKNFLPVPKPVTVVVEWAIEHKDCLDELFAALRGSFAGAAYGESFPANEVAAVRLMCDEDCDCD